MITATVIAVLILFGGGRSEEIPLVAKTKFVDRVLDDQPRIDQVLELQAAFEARLEEIQERGDALLERYIERSRHRATTSSELREMLNQFEDIRDEAVDLLLDHRESLRGLMDREEWERLYE